jgi:abortive infection bacteriophage resistance protein
MPSLKDPLFLSQVPNQILFDLLETLCIKTERYYLFDWSTFRKLKYYEPLYNDFKDAIVTHYRETKRFYVNREVTYNTVTTIIRQICKHNGILCEQKIKYNGPSYNIDYYIYYN